MVMKHTCTAAAIAATLLFAAACQAVRPVGEVAGRNQNGGALLAEIRAANGLPALAPDSRLEQAAIEQAGLMAGAGRMSHTTGFGHSFARRMRANGVDGAAAENIAHGAFGVDELFQRWLNSPPHRRNMLDPDYRRFGLASAREPGGSRNYWALVLAK